MSSTTSVNPLDNIPVQQPPEGERSNFVDPVSLGPQIIIVDAIFTALMIVMVLLRTFVRWKWVKVWEWSDYACLVSALGSVLHMVMDVIAIEEAGFGRHMWDVPVSWVLNDKNVRYTSSNGVIFAFSIFFAKLSILLMYLRIFSISKSLQRSIYVGLLIMALFYTAMVCVGIAAVVRCVGLAASTNQFCKNDGGPVQLVQSAFNVVTDFWMLILPMPLVLRLQMPRARKIGLVAVFAAGVVACGASLARLIEFAVRYHSTDIYWDRAVGSEVSAIEMNLAIMVSCATSLPQFLVKTKVCLHSTVSSLRRRVTSLFESRNISRRTSRKLKTEDLELDSYCEVRDFAASAVPASALDHFAQKSPRTYEEIV